MRDDALAVVKWLERFAPVPKWRDDGTPITKQWEIKDVHFIVKEAWLFTPRDASEKPLDFLNEIYDQRMQYKRASPTMPARNITSFRSIVFMAKWRNASAAPDRGWLESPAHRKPILCGGDHGQLSPATGRSGSCIDPHAVVAFMTDGIVTTRRLESLPNVVNEGDESRLGDWEYAPVEGGTFLHAGVYSMRKAGKELTKTRGVDPKRVSANENAGRLLVSKAVEAMSREYHPDFAHIRKICRSATS